MLFKETTVDVGRVTNASVKAAQLIQWRNSEHLACISQTGQLLICDLRGDVQCEFDASKAIDLEQEIAITCFSSFCAVVNSKALRGIVFNLTDPDWRMPLEREDYFAEQCTWPIGFYQRQGIVFLIHSTQWNRLDITNLETGQRVTKREVAWDKEDKKTKNYLDYFHSNFHMSPDEKHFVINGWHWGPWDQLFAWNVDQFQVNYELGGRGLHVLDVNGYNWDRPCCFYDNKTIAWGYNELEAGNEETPKKQHTELVFQDIHTSKVVRRMKFEHFDLTKQKEVKGRLWFDAARKCFVCASNKTKGEEVGTSLGTTITSANGSLIKRWPETAQFVSTRAGMVGFIDQNRVKLIELPIDTS